MLQIALKMLFGDRAKFLTLVIGLSFSVFLLVQQGSIFCGLMLRTAQNVFETGAPIWVIDPTASNFNDTVDMKTSEVARVRSLPGVLWAVPMTLQGGVAQSDKGETAAIQVIGVDDESLIGIPASLIEGKYEDLNQPGAVIISKARSERFGAPQVGDEFEINDNRVKVVGLIDSKKSFAPFPVLYTTMSRVQTLIPDKQRIVSFILVKEKPDVDRKALCRLIEVSTGLKAETLWEFVFSTMKFWAANTGIPINFGINFGMVLLIGTMISAQTLYAFMIENIKYFGTFKAIGITNRMLSKMVVLQSLTVGLIGYGIGIGIASLFGYFLPEGSPLAYYTPWQLLVIILFLVMGFCSLASLLSLNRVLRVDPAIVFRG